MTRYRSAKTVPAVKRPVLWEIEPWRLDPPEECASEGNAGLESGFAGGEEVTAIVSISEEDIALPHERQ